MHPNICFGIPSTSAHFEMHRNESLRSISSDARHRDPSYPPDRQAEPPTRKPPTTAAASNETYLLAPAATDSGTDRPLHIWTEDSLRTVA